MVSNSSYLGAACVPMLCTPSASASSADGSESVAPSSWALRLPPGLDPSTLRSILDILPRCGAFSPTLGSISRPVRKIFARLNQRRSEKSPRDFGRTFAPAFDRRISYFRQRGKHGVGRRLTRGLPTNRTNLSEQNEAATTPFSVVLYSCPFVKFVGLSSSASKKQFPININNPSDQPPKCCLVLLGI